MQRTIHWRRYISPMLGVFAALALCLTFTVTRATSASAQTPFLSVVPAEVGSSLTGTGGLHYLAGRLPQNLSLATAPGVSVGTEAVSLQITAIKPSAAGFLVAYPTGQPPTIPTSNLNFDAHVTTTLHVLVALGATQSVTIMANVGTDVRVVIDGTADGSGRTGFNAVRPYRIVDSRDLWAGPRR